MTGVLYAKAPQSDVDQNLKQSLTGMKKHSYIPVIIAYTFYSITYTIVIPALPSLTLHLCNGNSTHSSYLYGLANFARYISEFFAAPLLGTGTDIIGRKPMLLGSFVICGIEYALLAFFPSIPMLFATRIMAGLFDCSNPTVYTIITDLALSNGDNVTTKFGLITALLGIGFVVGPLLGGILCDMSISLCFLISAVITGIGAVITLFFLEETLPLATMDPCTNGFVIAVAGSDSPQMTLEENENTSDADDADSVSKSPFFSPHSNTQTGLAFMRNNTNTSALTSRSAHSTGHDHCMSTDNPEPPVYERRAVKRLQDVSYEDLNPIPALILHMKNTVMRDLTIPLFISSLNVGTGSIWVIYQVHKYHSTSTEVGIYMAVYGVVSAFILGVLIKRLIPHYWNEQQAAVYGLILLAMQYTGYGLVPTYWSLFIVVSVFTIGMVSDPALKALIVKESLKLPDGATVQGNLQGVLCSIRTLATAFGSLIFSSLFAESLKMKPEASYISFLVAASLYLISAFYLVGIFYCFSRKTVEVSSDDEEQKESIIDDNQSVPSLASGQDFRTSESGWKSFFGSRNHSSNSLVPQQFPPPSPSHPSFAGAQQKGSGVTSPAFPKSSPFQRSHQQDNRQHSVGLRLEEEEGQHQLSPIIEEIPALHLLTGAELGDSQSSDHHHLHGVSVLNENIDTSVLLSSGMMGGYPAPILMPSSNNGSRTNSRSVSRC